MQQTGLQNVLSEENIIYSRKQKYSTPLKSSMNCYSKQAVQHCVLCLQYCSNISNHPKYDFFKV